MSKPEVVLFTTDDRLQSRLPQLVAARCELRTACRADELLRTVEPLRTRAVCVDLDRVTDGGHAEVRLLDEVRRLVGDLPLQLRWSGELPETLQRWLACHPVERMEGSFDEDRFVRFVEEATGAVVDPPSAAAPTAERAPSTAPARKAAPTFAELTAPSKARHSVPAGSESLAVLAGLSRSFETNTPEMQRMLEELEVAARHDVTILLIGETGSGKTFLSRLIHEVSPRRDEPFLHVACGALPAELIESELFGHVKGSFTSAHADKEGKFTAAGRGTILLDEIDVLTPEQQVKLLRVIETGEYEPVGSNRTHKTQARLVVASNLPLQPLVEQGKFRPDLYYRLNMLKFDVLPLRNRAQDIVPLAEKFIDQQSEKHGVAIREVGDDLYASLESYPWPGNVRELENVIQRAVIYAKDGVLTARQLPSHVLAGQAGPTNDPSVRLGHVAPARSALEAQVAVTERDVIEQALRRHGNCKTEAAKALGISRVTLYNKLKKYGIPN